MPVYSPDQIALVKGLLACAPRVETLRPGTIPRIARATGVKLNTVLAVVQGTQWKDVEPAPPEDVLGLVDWHADPDGWDDLPPQGTPLRREHVAADGGDAWTPTSLPHPALIADTFDLSIDGEGTDVVWRADRTSAVVTGKRRAEYVALGVFVLAKQDVITCLLEGAWPVDAVCHPVTVLDYTTYYAAQRAMGRSTARIERAAVQRAARVDLAGTGVRRA